MINRFPAEDLFPYTNRHRKPEQIETWARCEEYARHGWPDSDAVGFVARYKATDYLDDGNRRIAFLTNAGYGQTLVPIIFKLRND